MATTEGLTAALDQVIAFFNARKMDLPDNFFDRKAQFILNGSAFETMLGQSPSDPLILMLSRGAAGFRFTAKALQHAIPDARLERGDIITEGDPHTLTLKLWLSGKLRGSGEVVNEDVDVTLRLTDTGLVRVAEATVAEASLAKVKEARLRP